MHIICLLLFVCVFFLSWQRERCAKRHVALSLDLIKEFFRRFWLCVLVSQINMMSAVIFTLGFPLDSSSSCSLPLPPCHLFSVVALILDFCNYKLNWEHLCLFLECGAISNLVFFTSESLKLFDISLALHCVVVTVCSRTFTNKTQVICVCLSEHSLCIVCFRIGSRCIERYSKGKRYE